MFSAAELNNSGVLLFGSYLVGTFGSALSVIYAWNASNTSGHTKKSETSASTASNIWTNMHEVTINAITLVAFAFGNIAGMVFVLEKTSQYLNFVIKVRKPSSLKMPPVISRVKSRFWYF